MRYVISSLTLALVLMGPACVGPMDSDPAEGALGEAEGALGDFEPGSIGGSDFGQLDLGHLDLGGPSGRPNSGHTTDEEGMGLTEITCLPSEYGVPCMMRCAESGINCAGGRQHPFKKGAGLGLLGKGRSLLGATMDCWYHYPNGDLCMFPRLGSPLCQYTTCP